MGRVDEGWRSEDWPPPLHKTPPSSDLLSPPYSGKVLFTGSVTLVMIVYAENRQQVTIAGLAVFIVSAPNGC